MLDVVFKRKPRENIKVCVNVSRTSYRQATDRLPTHYQQSADCRSTVGRQVAYISGKTCRPSVGQLSADKRPTVGRLSADRRPTVGRLSADCRPTVDRQSADRFFGELFFTITNIPVIPESGWKPFPSQIYCFCSTMDMFTTMP